jgi:hypothetical protein
MMMYCSEHAGLARRFFAPMLSRAVGSKLTTGLAIFVFFGRIIVFACALASPRARHNTATMFWRDMVGSWPGSDSISLNQQRERWHDRTEASALITTRDVKVKKKKKRARNRPPPRRQPTADRMTPSDVAPLISMPGGSQSPWYDDDLSQAAGYKSCILPATSGSAGCVQHQGESDGFEREHRIYGGEIPLPANTPN